MFDAKLPLQLRLSDNSGHEFDWGIMITEKGAIYEGFFNDTVREGYGRQVYPDGLIYVGDWYNDQAYGFGKSLDPLGNNYEGQFFKNLQHGTGTLIFKDKSVYHGSI